MREAPAAGGAEADAFVGCLTAGLRQLPSYRGAVVRAAATSLRIVAPLLVPGDEFTEPLPVSAVAPDNEYLPAPADHYVIWSITGRRAAPLLTDTETAAPASPDRPLARNELLFAPATRFRLLGTAERSGATVMLLRELPELAPRSTGPGVLDDSDSVVIARLRALTDRATGVSSARHWLDRCTGMLGLGGMGGPDARTNAPAVTGG